MKEQREEVRKSETRNIAFASYRPDTKSKIMQLGHAFTQAVAEGETKLAQTIIQEAMTLRSRQENPLDRTKRANSAST